MTYLYMGSNCSKEPESSKTFLQRNSKKKKQSYKLTVQHQKIQHSNITVILMQMHNYLMKSKIAP